MQTTAKINITKNWLRNCRLFSGVSIFSFKHFDGGGCLTDLNDVFFFLKKGYKSRYENMDNNENF